MSRPCHCTRGSKDPLLAEAPANTSITQLDQSLSAAAGSGRGKQQRNAASVNDNCGDPLPLPSPLAPAVRRVADAVFAVESDDLLRSPVPAVPGYEVLGEISRGGMGVIYKARQNALGRTVALKMVLLGVHAGPTQLARFRREALATARLQHPNIVQIHAVGHHEGIPFLALEFIDGPSLADLLRINMLPVWAAAELTEILARALQYAHGQRIVHRDLKPANVMLAPCGEGVAGAIQLPGDTGVQCFLPKITDFGLAKLLGDDRETEPALQSTLAGELIGTPHYMAPEQARAPKEQARPAADVYSLGATLYEMLTGSSPFQGVSPADTLRLVREQEPVAPRMLQRDVPIDLETICVKCLEKDPVRRYPDAGQLADDLGRFLSGRPIIARPPRIWEHCWRWAYREKWKALSLIVTVLAAFVLIGGGWWSAIRLSMLADKLRFEARRADAAAHSARQERNQAQQQEREAARLQVEAERQREIAEQNFRQARQLVDRFINRLADDPRLRQYGLDDVRRELLSASAEAYHTFAKQRSSDPQILSECARATLRLSRLTSQIALKKDALKLGKEAVTMLEQLTKDRPQDVILQLELASAYVHLAGISIDLRPDRTYAATCIEKALSIYETQAQAAPGDARIAQQLLSTMIALGGTYRDQRRTEPSGEMLQRALVLAKRLVQENPSSDVCMQDLATAYLNRGFLHAVEHCWQQSEEDYRKSLELYEHLARKNPTNLAALSLLAENRSWLASVLTQLNRRTEALALLEDARRFQELRLQRPAVVTSDQIKLATTYHYLGHVQRDEGYWNEAIEWYGKAIGLHQSILKKEPQRDRSAIFLAGVRLDRAELLYEMSRTSEADADWQQALMRSRSTLWRREVRRAERLARQGDAESVETLVEKLVAAGFTAGSELGQLARIYCLAAIARSNNEGLARAEPGERGGDCASLAIKLLCDARHLGWLNDPANQRLLRTHADFQVLQAHCEFENLLNSMTGP